MRLQWARLKHRLFPSNWRVRCLEMLDHSDGIFEHELCWPIVREQARRGILLSKGKKAEGVASTDLSAANLVLDLIARLSERQITLGDKHVYRGVLGFDGTSYRSIAKIALYELHENGWLDSEELQERLDQIDEAVRAAG